MNKTLNSVLLTGCLLGFGNLVNATPLTWYLNATFTDYTPVTGSFVYDADDATISGWDITTQDGDLSGYNYTPVTSTANCALSLECTVWGVTQFLYFNLYDPMSDSGGTITMYIVETEENGAADRDDVFSILLGQYTDGFITTVPPAETPEPTTLALLGLGLFGLGFSRRKKT